MLISFWLFLLLCMDQFSLLLHRRRRNLRPWLHCTGYPYSASTSTNNQSVAALTGGGGTDSVRLHMGRRPTTSSLPWQQPMGHCSARRRRRRTTVPGLTCEWSRTVVATMIYIQLHTADQWLLPATTTNGCSQPMTAPVSRQRWLLLCSDVYIKLIIKS